ncbi:MAG: hypothetical protein V4606_01695 [Patescibacteria group bacterium]
MARKRGTTHTTLTDTADLVVRELERAGGIKMIAPGIIDAKRSGKRYITAIYTSAGFELIISGTGVQKVAVHLTSPIDGPALIKKLQNNKNLQLFTWNQRDKKPGI